jgi:hypothetical protein
MNIPACAKNVGEQPPWEVMVMKSKKSSIKPAKKAALPRETVASLAAKRFEDQTRRMLGAHDTNKYGVRRGR